MKEKTASLTTSERETDLLRLNDLVRQHGLAYRKHGRNSYYIDDRTGADAFSDGYIYVACGLGEALAFAEGFDRAKGQKLYKQNEEELRKLATFKSALRKSGL